jgi:hypothetical protein
MSVYCVTITPNGRDHLLVRLSDPDGVVCTYGGYTAWVKHRLLTEHNITLTL